MSNHTDKAHQRTVETLKGGDPKYADVYGQTVRHGVVDLSSGHRYEGCTYSDCLINAIGVEDIDLAMCDLRGATIHVENASNINIVGNSWTGEYQHTYGERPPRNEQIGGRAAITTSGAVGDVLMARNTYHNVQRAFLAIVNHADIIDITHFCEVFNGSTRMTSAAGYNASGECVLYHGSGPGTKHTARNIQSIRCRWNQWNPQLAKQLRYDWPFDPSSYQRSALHFHDVNADGVLIERPQLGLTDVIRFVASKNYDSIEGASPLEGISNIDIVKPIPGQGFVSAYGAVSLDPARLGGMTVMESTSSSFYEATK